MVASGCCEVGHAVRTLRTKEVVQRDAQDVDGRRKRLARPVPPVENLRERVPVCEGTSWACAGDGPSIVRRGWPREVIRGVAGQCC